MKLVERLLENGGRDVLAISVDQINLYGPGSLRKTLNPGRLVTAPSMLLAGS